MRIRTYAVPFGMQSYVKRIIRPKQITVCVEVRRTDEENKGKTACVFESSVTFAQKRKQYKKNKRMNGMWLALLIPLAGTMLGSAFVFFMRKEMPALLQKTLLGFAAGVMVAASVWSLLIPSIGMTAGGKWAVLPAALGLLLGIGFLLLIDAVTPHLHVGETKPEGVRSHLSRTAMLSLAVTIHNFPEGMAVGVVIAGAMQQDLGISIAGAMAMSIGIAIQNVPEGAIISMPMRAAGNTRRRAFALGSLSGIVEPIGGLLIILLSEFLTPALPYFLSFAAGAMLYVVIEELIPEASSGEHSNLSTIGFAVGFVLMMVLDVVLG